MTRWTKSKKDANFHFWFLTITSLITLFLALADYAFKKTWSSPLGVLSALLLAIASFAYSDYHYYAEKEV